MFKLNDTVPSVPESFLESKIGEHTGKARVIYIHPEGRFYVLEYNYKGGSFRESRLFTDAERTAGYREGIFRKTFVPKRYDMACPPGYTVAGFEDDSGAFVSGYKTRTPAKPQHEEFDAAMF